jgi:adenine-specific DNA-methyltransferase
MPQEFTPQYNFTDDRLNELKQLFPEAWEDGVFNVDTLKALIGDFSTDSSVKEHFGLNWVGKQDARKIAAKPPTGTLKPCLGEGVNEDTTENIFIEGENLEVLKILRKSYMGKIKMIYIDPPYNTGNDFIYNDTFADSTEDYLRKTGEKSDEGLLVSNPKSSGKYHANWLTFMYPRLRLAKDLLKEDGVIFISIDNNEFDNLKKVCDEIFGEENFISAVANVNNPKGRSDDKYIATAHEYVMVYQKSQITFYGWEPEEKVIRRYNKEDEDGTYREIDLRKTGDNDRREDRPNLFYYFLYNEKTKDFYPTTNTNVPEGYIQIYPTREDKSDGNWRWELKTAQNKMSLLIPKFMNVRKKWSVAVKDYLTDDKRVKPTSAWTHKWANSERGTEQFVDLGFDKRVFKNPKPIGLIQSMLKMATSQDDIVLDFFTGSGSSAQAVLELNKEENEKKRKFICVQIAEKVDEEHIAYKEGFKVISDVSKERINRTLKKLEDKQGFKVYKQDNSTIYKWQDFKSEQDGALPDLFSKMELAYKNPLQDGVTTQGFITEVILQEGFPLTAKQEEVASGIFKITHEWLPYTLYATMLYSFKNTDFGKLQLHDTDHFVCLDKAFEGNDALKQEIDNQCKLFTI